MYESLDVPVIRDDSPAVRPPLLRPQRPPSRSLADFMAAFGGIRVDTSSATDHRDITLTGVAAATPDVAPGDLFVALPGARDHGAGFSRHARDNGASAVATDAAGALRAGRAGLPTVVMDAPRRQLAARTEDPSAIRSALSRGARHARNRPAVHEVPEPADAIRKAIALARPQDAILWAGPGSTDYRVVGGDRIPYSPRQDARDALHEAGWL